MSARASGYMKALVVCPNGERITPREKLVGMVLADSHQDKARRFTYPSVDTIAEESMSDRRTCQRYLAALERKGVIRRLRPANQGRGAQVFYFFPALEDLPEGWHDAALSTPDIFSEKGGGRAAEGRRKGGNLDAAHIERAQEREQEQQEQKQNTPLPPSQASGECEVEKENDAQPLSDPQIAATVQVVMIGCGWTDEKLRRIIAAQLDLQEQSGEGLVETSQKMIAAWKLYKQQGLRLRFKWGARKFIGEGYWSNSESWPWDAVVLREERQRANARVGTWHPD